MACPARALFFFLFLLIQWAEGFENIMPSAFQVKCLKYLFKIKIELKLHLKKQQTLKKQQYQKSCLEAVLAKFETWNWLTKYLRINLWYLLPRTTSYKKFLKKSTKLEAIQPKKIQFNRGHFLPWVKSLIWETLNL